MMNSSPISYSQLLTEGLSPYDHIGMAFHSNSMPMISSVHTDSTNDASALSFWHGLYHHIGPNFSNYHPAGHNQISSPGNVIVPMENQSKFDLPPFPNDYHSGIEISPQFTSVNAFTNVPMISPGGFGTGTPSLSDVPMINPREFGTPSLSDVPMIDPGEFGTPSLSDVPMIDPGEFGTPSLSDVPMINPREFGTPSLSDVPMINPREFGTPFLSDVPMVNPGEFGTPSLSNDNCTGAYCSSSFTSELNPIINQKIGNVAKPDNLVPNGAHHPLPDANCSGDDPERDF
ncbi:hypothetical protein niasHT_011819 [Heterodera trifolii]|uniref:Uncharacterized protein n=1 Tax=Heterodera trifolii TaxID=157864 RepID=A0ABD2L5M8_9BILA